MCLENVDMSGMGEISFVVVFSNHRQCLFQFWIRFTISLFHDASLIFNFSDSLHPIKDNLSIAALTELIKPKSIIMTGTTALYGHQFDEVGAPQPLSVTPSESFLIFFLK